MRYSLIKLTDTSGTLTGDKGHISYRGLTDRELADLYDAEDHYRRIGFPFEVDFLGYVTIPSLAGIGSDSGEITGTFINLKRQ